MNPIDSCRWIFVALFLVCILFLMCVLVCRQEGSDHEEVEDADGEEEEFDMAGEETSDESDSEELEEKGTINHNKASHLCTAFFFFFFKVRDIRI